MRSPARDRGGKHSTPLFVLAALALVRERPKRKNDALWAALTGLSVFLITYARVPTAWTTIWAEDGKVFLAGAVNQGFGSFFHFFGGYLHTVPRIGALIAATLPLSMASVVMTTYAVVISSACGAAGEMLSGAYIKARWARVGLGLCFGLLPAIRVESIAEMANLQYFLIATSFWVLLVEPRSKAGRWLSLVFLSATAASTILGIVLIPVAVIRLIDRRIRLASDLHRTDNSVSFHPSILPAAVFLAVEGLHAILILIVRPTRDLGWTVSFPDVAYHFVTDVIAGQFFGGPFYSLDHQTLTLWVINGVAIICVAALLSHWPRGASRQLVVAVGAIVLGALTYLTEAKTQGTVARYAVVPGFFVLFGVAIVADIASRLRGVKPVAGVLVLGVVLSWAFSFSVPPYRYVGPHWSTEYSRAQSACKGKEGVVEQIPVLPEGWGTMALPCSAFH